MKIKSVMLICTIFLFMVCKAQICLPKFLELKKENSIYFIDNNQINCVTYKFYNKGDKTIWLWIEKNDLSKITDSKKIRGYFLQNKGDASLYEIGMDGNVESFTPGIFDTFIKRILPKKYFSIQIISKGNISEFTKQEMFKYLDNRITSYTEKDLLGQIPTLNKMSDIVFFKEEFIIIPLDILMTYPALK